MSHPESAAQAKTPVHWTVKSNYRLRTGSFAIMFTSIVFHGWDKNYSPAFWSLIALHLLVYPHLMFWRARRAANTQQAEVNNLAMDSLLFGILAAALQFPLWISFTVYIASTLNITISRGTRGMLLSQLGFFGGALIPIVLFGWHVSPDTGWPATLVCLAGNMVYMISIGIAAFGRNQQLRKTREALRLGEQTLKQQLAEIQNLQEKLQEQASRDPLTGMYNRRFLDTIVGREIADHHQLCAPGLAHLSDQRRARHFAGHVQRIHRRGGAVAGLRATAKRLAHRDCQCDYRLIGGGHFGDETAFVRLGDFGHDRLSLRQALALLQKNLLIFLHLGEIHAPGILDLSCCFWIAMMCIQRHFLLV
jgi:hypothetical protein